MNHRAPSFSMVHLAALPVRKLNASSDALAGQPQRSKAWNISAYGRCESMQVAGKGVIPITQHILDKTFLRRIGGVAGGVASTRASRAAEFSEGFISLNDAMSPTVAACQANAILGEVAKGNLALWHYVARHTATPAMNREGLLMLPAVLSIAAAELVLGSGRHLAGQPSSTHAASQMLKQWRVWLSCDGIDSYMQAFHCCLMA